MSTVLTHADVDASEVEEAMHVFGAAHPKAIALAYSPASAQFLRHGSDGWRDGKGSLPSWSSIFEVRAFDEQAELRWIREPGGMGVPWTVAEGAASADDPAAGPVMWGTEVERILWGQRVTLPEPPPEGWTVLSTPRVGTLRVPLPDDVNRTTAALVVAEYASHDEHGNWSICDERLIAVRWVA